MKHKQRLFKFLYSKSFAMNLLRPIHYYTWVNSHSIGIHQAKLA
ncbi:hypothetical protein [Microscilla marina]|uniref:Uncharacterized protein n=1 Tax=Microscilla marina ATCC 23134 TaxID=313606 RepID=A1ZT44_MICM2|nr:hypothetical protein [Microscilla marina]EAY26434.1 hypothetical protein M23134_07029 [Microscilla marina ATCC 23134]